MRIEKVICMIVAWAAVSVASAAYAEDQAKQTVEGLFGDSIRKAMATADPQDNLELARSLLEAAGNSQNNPEVVGEVCRSVVQLVSNVPAGTDLAIAAMRQWGEADPVHQIQSLESIVDLRQQQYARAVTDQRAAATSQYVEAMMELVDVLEQAGENDKAMLTLRRASSLSRTMDASYQEQIRARLGAAVTRQKIQQKIDLTQRRLRNNPEDRAAATELVRLYIVEFDQPDEARKYSFLIDDEQLKTNITLASRPIESLSEAESLALAKWYADLKSSAMVPASTIAMLRRTQSYYSRVLELHTTEDIQRASAMLALKQIDTQLSALESESPDIGSGNSMAGHNLLKLLDPGKHVMRGKAAVQGDSLVIPESARFYLPAHPTGDYEFQLQFVNLKTDGNPKQALTVRMPAGDAQFNLQIAIDHGAEVLYGIDEIDGHNINYPNNPYRIAASERLSPGDVHTATVKVKATGPNGAITASIDGKVIAEWKGGLTKIRTWPGLKNLGPARAFLFNVYKGPIAIKAVKVRPLSGSVVGVE